MKSATSVPEVGVRELRNHLSKFLERVARGEEFLVTDHGRPVARLTGLDATTDRLQHLLRAGLIVAPREPRQNLPEPVEAQGSVSDLVADQRR